MIVGSHYQIGGFIYRFIISKYIPFSPIDKIMFQAGNMLPDLTSELSKLEHTVEGASKSYQYHMKKAQDLSLASGERMLSLGIMCHYLSDSFCTYHAKEPYKNLSMPRHLFYEFRLHLVLLFTMLSARKMFVGLLSEEAHRIEPQSMEPFLFSENKSRFQLQRLFLSLKEEYDSQRSTIRTDIQFALKAGLLSTAAIMEECASKAPARLVFDVSAPSDGSLHRSR